MFDGDDYKLSVSSMFWVFEVQEWSYEYTNYYEFFEREIQKLREIPRDYE